MKHPSTEEEIDLILLLKQIWTKRKMVFRWALCGLLVGVILAFSIPREYETAVVIAPEGKATNGTLGSMGALAGMMGVNLNSTAIGGIGEKLYPEIVQSSPFLLEFADMPVLYKGNAISMGDYILKYQKYPWWKYVFAAPGMVIGWLSGLGKDAADTLTIQNSPELRQAFTGLMKKRVKGQQDKKSGVYSFTATMQDPEISMQVADSLITKLQRYMTDYRTCKTRMDLKSNENMLVEAKQKYYAIDEEYAALVDRNQNLISKSAQIQLDRVGNERNLAFNVYQQMATQVEANRLKLQEDTPIATVIEPARLPLHPSSPRRKILIAVLTFLGGCAAAGWIVVKEFLFVENKQDD